MAEIKMKQAHTGPLLQMTEPDGFLELDRAQARAAGAALHDIYDKADPYPHIVIDQLIDPAILQRVNDEFPVNKAGRFADDFSQLKTGYTLDAIRSAYIHSLLAALNSAPFIVFLEQLTGIKGLTSDPFFFGGGLHETRRGGHLSIHADFNVHPRLKLQRRLNLILFLNDGWDENWGGKLELWDRKMTRCRQSVLPEIGRAVIFNTDSENYHGHPDPLDCPSEVTRRSIALYYYSMPKRFVLPHTTAFRARPGSNDARESPVTRALDSLKRLVAPVDDS